MTAAHSPGRHIPDDNTPNLRRMELCIVNPANKAEHICLVGIKVEKKDKMGRYCARTFIRAEGMPCCSECISE